MELKNDSYYLNYKSIIFICQGKYKVSHDWPLIK